MASGPLFFTYTYALSHEYKDEDYCVKRENISEAGEKVILVPGHIDLFKPDPIGKIIIDTHGANPYSIREKSKYSSVLARHDTCPPPGSFTEFTAPTGQIIVYLWCMEGGNINLKHLNSALQRCVQLLEDKTIAIPCGWPVSIFV